MSRSGNGSLMRLRDRDCAFCPLKIWSAMIRLREHPRKPWGLTPSLHRRALDHLRSYEIGAEPLNIGDGQLERLSSGGE